MAFQIQFEGNFNPFEWDEFFCPTCNGKHFTSVSHTGVYCDKCNTRFSVRCTAGDPGCVVDAFFDMVYAPLHQCAKCVAADGEYGKYNQPKFGLFDWQDKTCTKNLNHGDMEHEQSMSTKWKLPSDWPEYMYMIMKTHDYCSGWLSGGNGSVRRTNKGDITDAKWIAYCEAGFRNLEQVNCGH